jgi:hypothetical protein
MKVLVHAIENYSKPAHSAVEKVAICTEDEQCESCAGIRFEGKFVKCNEFKFNKIEVDVNREIAKGCTTYNGCGYVYCFYLSHESAINALKDWKVKECENFIKGIRAENDRKWKNNKEENHE